MRNRHFYNHLVETSILSLELGDMDLAKEERLHLTTLIEANLHTTIVDLILSELSDEDKKIFLMHLSVNDHDKIWKHLKGKIADIEEKIKKIAEDLKKELHQDIKEVRLAGESG